MTDAAVTSEKSVLIATDVVGGYVPGVDILQGCSLHVDVGELVAIIGPNGAGKSTLVKAVFGLVRIRSGSVQLFGSDITNAPTHSVVDRGVGYVPQVRNVFASLSVADNLRMGSYLKPKHFAQRESELLALFPRLAERHKSRAGSLSGGERQMLAMARALMTTPAVLLLDEPSAGLSPIMQDDVFERIAAIASSGVSVLIVEQNARKCLQIADRGYVLDQGRNAYTGTGRSLLDDPKVIDLYLGSLHARRNDSVRSQTHP